MYVINCCRIELCIMPTVFTRSASATGWIGTWIATARLTRRDLAFAIQQQAETQCLGIRRTAGGRIVSEEVAKLPVAKIICSSFASNTG